MKKFLVLFCRYDPDNYRGYYRHEFEAVDMEAAQEVARSRVNVSMFMVNGDVEYQVYEITAQTSPRLWNVAEKTHR